MQRFNCEKAYNNNNNKEVQNEKKKSASCGISKGKI